MEPTDEQLDYKKEIRDSLKHVSYTINGINRIKSTYNTIKQYNENILRRKKLMLNHYITEAEVIIYDEIKQYRYLDFIFPGAYVLICEYDSRVHTLKTYLNQLITSKLLHN